jgi:hypothetical protein
METEIPKSLPLKRKRNNYRLVVMNDDTYEEIITFRLSRVSVYIASSAIFVLLISFSVALLVFTPLKFYIPGYGTRKSLSELQNLKIRTDSLENVLRQKEQYIDGVKKVLTGNTPILKDTTTINLPQNEYTED